MTLAFDAVAAPGTSHRLRSSTQTVLWGRLPRGGDAPAITVESGSLVVIDTVSHEGLMPDQGQAPLDFFARFGVSPSEVRPEVVELADALEHDPDAGPHIITGPIAVTGAEPGDVLEIEVVALEPLTRYGIVSNRHGCGALPGEMPLTPGTVSTFAEADFESGTGSMRTADGRELRFPLRPFLGIIGVATPTPERVSSVPPGAHGGNLDMTVLGVGATLHLPVLVPEALAYVGDPHFSQGDGEVALTAFEAPLRATLRLTLRRRADHPADPIRSVTPFAETASHWHPVGLDHDLDEAVKDCVRKALRWMEDAHGIDRPTGLAYLSAAADVGIAQVVDQVKGVYASIRKSDFAGI